MIFHFLRSMRSVAKGALLYRGKAVTPKAITSRCYIGLRVIDAFMHMNNGRYIELFELARWESFTASGANGRLFKARCYPVVSGVSINFFRQVSAFQIATIQTSCLGVAAGGNSFVVLQSLIDSRGNLCATALFFATMIDARTGKSCPARDVVQRSGWAMSDFCVAGDLELSLADDGKTKRVSAEQIAQLAAIVNNDSGLDSGIMADGKLLVPLKVRHHDIVSERTVTANAAATMHVSESFKNQREWFRDRHVPLSFAPEAKFVHGHDAAAAAAAAAEGKGHKRK